MKNCKCCGKMHDWKMAKSPAYGKIYDKWSTRNHFSSVCHQKHSHTEGPHLAITCREIKVHEVHSDLSPASEDELRVLSFPDQVNFVGRTKNQIYATMEVGIKTVRIQVDTGASCNVLPHRYLSTATEIRRKKRELVTYSKSKLSVPETATESVRNPQNNREYTIKCCSRKQIYTNPRSQRNTENGSFGCSTPEHFTLQQCYFRRQSANRGTGYSELD